MKKHELDMLADILSEKVIDKMMNDEAYGQDPV